ncbi:hypothetical protein JST97_03280 [bacterium]|nr:hypothetical protein [bacterium]
MGPKHILTLAREEALEHPQSPAVRIYRQLHSSTQAPLIFSLKSVSTLLGAHYWLEAGLVGLPEASIVAVVGQASSLQPKEDQGALLVDGEGLFVWGADLESVRDRLEWLDFQLDFQLQLLSLPEQRLRRGPVLDGGWRLPPLPHAPTGIFSI